MHASTLTTKEQVTIPKNVRDLLKVEKGDRVESFINREEYLLINHLLVCELVWLMKQCYNYSKLEIVKIIAMILSTELFKIQNSQLIRYALKEYKQGNTDFVNYVVGRINKYNQWKHTITFNKKASLSNSFELLVANSEGLY